MSVSDDGTVTKLSMSTPHPSTYRTMQQTPSVAESGTEETNDSEILSETAFTKAFRLEQKRTERSSRRFIVMLLELASVAHPSNVDKLVDGFVHRLSQKTRETDIKGWYKTGTVFGIIFTELGDQERDAIQTTLLDKVLAALHRSIGPDAADQIGISFHLYPGDSDEARRIRELGPYSDAIADAHCRRLSHLIKRVIDIVGSISVLVFLSPLWIAIALAIKLTSAGPILFRQERVGRYGRKFTFLKFRSMFITSDDALHRDYVTRFIKAPCNGSGSTSQDTLFKLTNDPRVTAVGKLLRRTSLDELPQLLNVIRGDMSLVGPRPPIPYEVLCYDPWHKRRLAVKPGITGLWQVHGRSRVPFDEMVRLDLTYVRSWSLALDLRILLQTPWAVLKGSGAC